MTRRTKASIRFGLRPNSSFIFRDNHLIPEGVARKFKKGTVTAGQSHASGGIADWYVLSN